MSNIFDNSIWPNAGGTLGQNKVQIPDGVTTNWPEGDALVGNFVFNKGNLVGFVDTKALIVNDTKTTTINYDYVNIELPFTEDAMTINRGTRSKYLFIKFNDKEVEEGDSVIVSFKYKGCKTVDDVIAVDPDYQTTDIVDGVWSERLDDLEQGGNEKYNEGMFYYCSNLKSFSSNLSSLTIGSGMFCGCTKLTSFSSNLSSLTNGSSMFFYCSNLKSFNTNLSSLENGSEMFAQCFNLTTFTSDLSSLTMGDSMFDNCQKLESFTSDLSNLTNGSGMFLGCNRLTSFSCALPSLTMGDDMLFYCKNLESFSSDLSSLTSGYQMFRYCFNLTTFTSNLSNLTNGERMFDECKLNTASVQNIADTINTPSSKGTIHIGISNATPNDQEEAAFNKIASNNWTVYVGVNGGSSSQWNPTSLTPIDGEEQQTPIPFWAKPVPSDEKHAHYVDENGNFYNILGGNYIYGDNLSTYGMFTCEEDAAVNMRLTKIEK